MKFSTSRVDPGSIPAFWSNGKHQEFHHIFKHWEELRGAAKPWLKCSSFENLKRDFLYCLKCFLKQRSKSHEITATIMISSLEVLMSWRTLLPRIYPFLSWIGWRKLFWISMIICRSCSSVSFSAFYFFTPNHDSQKRGDPSGRLLLI